MTDFTPRYEREYALGFAFNPGRDSVVLIQKARPMWQAGLLNGVGGHVEFGEDPEETMCREYEEETGVNSKPDQWNLFAIMHGRDWQKDPTGSSGTAVFCYETNEPVPYCFAATKTDEEIIRVSTLEIATFQPGILVPNLPVLIPLALHRDLFQRPVEFKWGSVLLRSFSDN